MLCAYDVSFCRSASHDEYHNICRNFHLFAVDAVGTNGTDIPPVRDLTPGENVKAQNIFTNYRYPDQILVGTNERDSKCFDMYRVFLATGEKFLDTVNVDGDVIGWKTEDESFEIRAAVSGFGERTSVATLAPCPKHVSLMMCT